MKKTLLLLLLALSSILQAGPVDQNTALNVARTVLQNQENVELNYVPTEAFSNFYIFNGENSFAIVAADDCVSPVLAYSEEFPFRVDNMPDNLKWWMQSLNDGIQFAIDQRVEPTEEIREEWMLLTSGRKPAPKNRTEVKPLIRTHWNQEEPYNNLCPGGSVTGCVATMMAQIMKYWEWPITGTGSHSYNHSTYGQLYADFGNTTYDWDNMIESPTSSSTTAQQNAVATLMYHCGVAVDMDYSPSASSAYSYQSMLAFYSYFGYNQSDMQYCFDEDYTASAWISTIKEELDNGRPMCYRGSEAKASHAFICDGYDANDYLHFNWGWGGFSDGYFAYEALNTNNGLHFNTYNQIVKGIHPNTTPPIAAPTNLTATLSGLDVSLSWSPVSGANHYKVYRDGFVINTNVTGTTFTDLGLCYGNHDYYVKAVNSSGICSLRSNEVEVAVQYEGPVPSNLTATAQANNVTLNWDAPASENAQLKYGDSPVSNYSMGFNEPIYWGQRYTVSQLNPYAGMAVTSVQVFLRSVQQYTLFIFKEVDSELVQMYSQPFTSTTYGAWHTINLSTPLLIDYTHNLVVALYDSTGGYVICYTENCNGDDNAKLFFNFFDWGVGYGDILDEVSWLFKVNISDGNYTYNLYRDGDAIANNLSQTTYTDSGLDEGIYNYTVRTNYYGGLSEPSNVATAVVGPIQYFDITVSANPPEGGTVTGGDTYQEWTTATLTATPNEGYSFVNWTKDGTEVSTNANYTFTVMEGGDYVANFSLNSYEITVSANPSAGGMVDGGGTYNHGETATLSAVANEHYTFINWTLANGSVASEDESFSFTVTGAGTYYANFAIDTYDITASANPEEGGTIEGAGTYDYGATATLTATANEGYTFINWTDAEGSVVSEDESFSFEVTDEGDYVANFSLNSYEITVSANPTEGGTVDGAGTFNHGDIATLSAVANDNYTFVNWTRTDGAVASVESSFSFAVTEECHYVANFSFITHVITISVNPLNGGVVEGSGTYNQGETATISVTPNMYYQLLNWTENDVVVSEEQSFTITVTEDHQFVANLSYHYDDIEETGNATLVYPNPVNDKVWVESKEFVKAYEVYNTTGALVYSAVVNAERFEIDMDDLSAGTYLIRLVADNQTRIIRISKR